LQQLAINGNRGAQQEFSVSIKVSKEITPFQQAGVRKDSWFRSAM